MVNYEMRGTMCSSLVPFVLLRVLLWSLCANRAALGQPSQDTRLGAHGDADDVMRWEHWTGRSLLIDRGALLSNPYLILTLFIEPIDAAKFSRATSCMPEESKTTASFEMVKFVSNATGT